MKTIDDILRDIRRRNHGCPLDAEASHSTVEDMLCLADQIEAAVKTLEADRDNWRRQALFEDARANATAEKPSIVGNSAKLREALAEIRLLLARVPMSIKPDIACGIIASKAKSALAEPRRNCDVGTAEEQHKRFMHF